MNQTKRTVDPKLLEILVCPVTKKPLRYAPAGRGLNLYALALIALPARIRKNGKR